MNVIKFSECPELLNPKLTMKDIKMIIKDKTGIAEENQRFHVFFDFIFYYEMYNDDSSIWERFNLKIYDKSRYYAEISRHYYTTEAILDLNKKVGELKRMVFEQTKIPIDRQIFYHDNDVNEEISDDIDLRNSNLFRNTLSIKINDQLKDIIYVKYPNKEVKKIEFDLCKTGLELLEKIDNTPIYNVKYNIFYNDKKASLTDLLVNSGIKTGDKIELQKRETMQIYVRNLTGKTLICDAEPSDTIRLIKIFIEFQEGIPSNQMKLVFSKMKLEDNRSLADYNIQQKSTIYLIIKLRG